jgi:SAM-dependent methyltransferase
MSDNICKICGSQEYKGYLRFKDKGIIVCKVCKTFRTFPYPEIDYKEREFYCEHYLRNETLFRGFAKELGDIIIRHKTQGRVLDIGCAVGFVLEETRQIGFDAEGIDLNKKAVDIARSKGFSVKCCEIEKAGYPEGYFDVVVLNHILEHIIEPNKFIRDIERILKEDGILVIGVPNLNSLVARLYRTYWYGWGLPEHIWHFDRKSLVTLLSQTGFTIKELIQSSQYYLFSKSLRKNTMAIIARIGKLIEAGDQLVVVAEKV